MDCGRSDGLRAHCSVPPATPCSSLACEHVSDGPRRAAIAVVLRNRGPPTAPTDSRRTSPQHLRDVRSRPRNAGSQHGARRRRRTSERPSAFAESRVRYIGVDLAVGNGGLAAESGQTVIPASLFSRPFPASTFSAGWSMSTFQHVPDERIDDALTEFLRVLEPGAPVTVGLWGGRYEVIEMESSTSGLQLPRHFTLRTHDRIRSILGRHLVVASYEAFPSGPRTGSTTCRRVGPGPDRREVQPIDRAHRRRPVPGAPSALLAVTVTGPNPNAVHLSYIGVIPSREEPGHRLP